MHRFQLAILVAVFASGCASTKGGGTEVQDMVDRQILEASQKVQAAQMDLYQASAFDSETTKPKVSVAEDSQKVSISWQGDALQLVNQLARSRGLQFSFSGLRMPLPVNIDVKDRPFDEVLKLLRSQIGYRANLEQTADQLSLQYNKPQP